MEVATVDPSSPRFMLVEEDAETAVRKALEAEMSKEDQAKDGEGGGREQASL